jgi:hypothetical protein
MRMGVGMRMGMLRLRWSLLMVHGDAHVSLVLGWMGRRVRCRCAVAGHLHGLRSHERRVLERVGHGSRVALHSIRAGVRHVRGLAVVDCGMLGHGNCVVLLVRRGVRAPTNSVVVRRGNLAHGWWSLDVRRRHMVSVGMLLLPVSRLANGGSNFRHAPSCSGRRPPWLAKHLDAVTG